MRNGSMMVTSAIAVYGLAGCVDMSDGVAEDMTALSESEMQARSACVRDVRDVTGNTDVVAQSSSYSEDGTEVILLVGGTGTWSCIAYRNGTTAGIMSMTDEGTL